MLKSLEHACTLLYSGSSSCTPQAKTISSTSQPSVCRIHTQTLKHSFMVARNLPPTSPTRKGCCYHIIILHISRYTLENDSKRGRGGSINSPSKIAHHTVMRELRASSYMARRRRATKEMKKPRFTITNSTRRWPSFSFEWISPGSCKKDVT